MNRTATATSALPGADGADDLANDVLRQLLQGAEAQLSSAHRAAHDARADLGGALVFDCVGRKVLLADRFAEAGRAIADELGAPICGFALRAGDFSGFHNTTTGVLAFPQE